MKKVMLPIGLHLLLCSLLLAQTDNPGCQKNVSLKDSDCQQSSSCATATQCPRTLMTIDCAQSYKVKAYTACSGTNCAHCAACVRIKTMSGVTVYELFTNGTDYCENLVCCRVGTWNATSTGNYYFEVCLVPCNSVDGEACCTTYGCEAWGVLSDGALSCP